MYVDKLGIFKYNFCFIYYIKLNNFFIIYFNSFYGVYCIRYLDLRLLITIHIYLILQ